MVAVVTAGPLDAQVAGWVLPGAGPLRAPVKTVSRMSAARPGQSGLARRIEPCSRPFAHAEGDATTRTWTNVDSDVPNLVDHGDKVSYGQLASCLWIRA